VRFEVKKTLIAVVVGVLLVVGAGLLVRLAGVRGLRPRGQPPYGTVEAALAPPFDRLEFVMAYRGLTGEEGDLQYNSYWGFGGDRNAGNSFIEAVRAVAANTTPVYNPRFKGAEYAMIEHEGSKVKALYFDLNADGKLTDNEKITSFRKSPGNPAAVDIFTPDFQMETEDGRKVMFRGMLQVAFYGSEDQPNCMWSPACVLEGQSEVAGQPVTLVLYTNGFDGEFDRFGQGSYSLLAGKRATGQYAPRQTLSKIISHQGRFYQVSAVRDQTTGQVARVVLEKDTTPTGTLRLRLAARSNTNAGLNNATLKGRDDDGIHFSISGNQEASTLPAGVYVVSSGYIRYGPDDESWNVSFANGPQVAVEPNQTVDLEIGEPKMTVAAVDAAQRYSGQAEDKTVFAKGTTVYLSPKVTGKTGETYGRFARIMKNNYTEVKPEVEIHDAAGKQVVSQTLEYG